MTTLPPGSRYSKRQHPPRAVPTWTPASLSSANNYFVSSKTCTVSTAIRPINSDGRVLEDTRPARTIPKGPGPHVKDTSERNRLAFSPNALRAGETPPAGTSERGAEPNGLH